ncbi:dynamin family protein [Megasphaera stantonii]|uniref:dynamin family protein n=1 Tax=Megasphaera stantonii TaxID=2144175 RepID=UPI003208CA67
MDLKAFRENKLKINTPQEFADFLGIDVAIITQWEQSPESISQITAFEVVGKIAEKTGLPFDEIVNFKKATIQPLSVPNNWGPIGDLGKTLFNYIQEYLPELNLSDSLRTSYIDTFQQKLASCLVKPKIAIVGRSDTGKSTLINALLGAEKMPTSWTPTTSAAVYIKHISDRPKFMEPDDVWIFASQVGNETAWDDSRLYDETYCNSWKIAAGDITELSSYCVRQGDQYDKQAGAAVVFVDSPILNSCDIVDLPGFGTETIRDDEITFSVSQKASILIYLSQANGFMRMGDITYLKRNIAELPVLEKADVNPLLPLSNLFIVASQAHTIDNGNREEIRNILDSGCDRLLETFSYAYWNNREAVSGYSYPNKGKEILKGRFFAYTTDIPDLCQPFNEALSQTLEILPSVREKEVKKSINDYIRKCLERLSLAIQENENITEKHEAYIKLLSKMEEDEPERIKTMDKEKRQVLAFIEQYRSSCISEFYNYFSLNMTPLPLEERLKKEKIKYDEEEIKHFVSKIQNELQQNCESILNKKAQLLTPKIKNYLSVFSQNTTGVFNKQNFTIDFDAGWAYSSVLSTIPQIGALSALGGLGGLIFTSSLLIAPIAFLAGLMIAVPAGILVGLGRLFGDSWQKKLAQKLYDKLKEINCKDKYVEGINAYWKQTSEAFDKATLEVEKQWQDRVADIRGKVTSNNIEELNKDHEMLESLSDFFTNMSI